MSIALFTCMGIGFQMFSMGCVVWNPFDYNAMKPCTWLYMVIKSIFILTYGYKSHDRLSLPDAKAT